MMKRKKIDLAGDSGIFIPIYTWCRGERACYARERYPDTQKGPKGQAALELNDLRCAWRVKNNHLASVNVVFPRRG